MQNDSLMSVKPLPEVLVWFVFDIIKGKVENGMVSLEYFCFVGIHNLDFSHHLVM